MCQVETSAVQRVEGGTAEAGSEGTVTLQIGVTKIHVAPSKGVDVRQALGRRTGPNEICESHGLSSNPARDRFSAHLWKAGLRYNGGPEKVGEGKTAKFAGVNDLLLYKGALNRQAKETKKKSRTWGQMSANLPNTR